MLQDRYTAQPLNYLPSVKTPSGAVEATETNLPTQSGPSGQTSGRNIKKILIIILAVLTLIIMIITAIFIYKRQPIKHRDAQRKTNFAAIQIALENSRADSLNNTYYPSAITTATLENPGYIVKIPTDPKNISPFVYTYIASPTACTSKCTGYTLTGCLENKNDKEKNTTNPIAPCTTRSYRISK